MTRTSSLLRNVLSNWLVLALGIAYTFVVTPIVVRSLGIEGYGVWSFLNGLLAYSELLYLGLGSAVVKYVAQYRARNDLAGINRLASVVGSIYGLLGLISLTTLIGISQFVPGMFAEALSADSANAAVVTCMLLGVRLLMVFLSSTFAGLLSGYDRYDLVNAVNLLSVTIRFVATPLLLQVGWNPLLTMAWLTTAVGVIDFIALTIVGFWTVRGLVVKPVRPRAEELRWLYVFGLQSFFIVFAVKLISYTDTMVIGVILGAASVALYSLPLQLVEFARMFVGGFTAVFLPRVTISSTKEDEQGIRDVYIRSTRIAFFFVGWLGGGLITLGPMFLGLWVGPHFGGVSRSVLVFLVLALMGQVLSSQVPMAFYQGLGLLAVPAIVISIEGVLNLSLSIWLAPRLGLPGVALATAVPAIVSLVVLPPYLCRKLKIPIRLLFDSIAPGVAMIVAIVAIQTAVAFAVPSASWLALILRTSVTAPIAVAIVMSMFPDDERKAILRRVGWPRGHQSAPAR